MSTPPGLVGAAVLFWGWQTGLLPLALPIAAMLECARVVPWRWDFTRREFDRLADLSTIVFVGVVVYFALAGGANRAVIGVFQWLPVIWLPLVVSQALSGGTPIELATLFWSLRGPARREGTGRQGINLGYPYFALCILSASSANIRDGQFYAGLCLLAAWAFWAVKPRHVPVAAWAGAVVAVSLLGWAGHIGLHRSQVALETALTEWFGTLSGQHDPFRTTTQIGQVGALKLADRVVLRVEPGIGGPPARLREATYNAYHASTWFAVASPLADVPARADGTTWRLRASPESSGTATIAGSLRRGRGVLALPEGAFELRRLPAVGMRLSRLGAVTIDEGPAFVSFTVVSARGPAFDGRPTENDLRLPAREAAVLSRLAEDLRLPGRAPDDAVAAVETFLRKEFRYAMFVPEQRPGPDALEDFLLRTRAGHCEYFAAATVLLLRAAGVPARYAVGYSVDEFSPLERRYLVRARHAHAWALAYVNGAWHDVDTTPGDWRSVEAAGASTWESFWDVWSWLAFLVTRWRWSEGTGTWAGYLGWLLIPLSAALIWRVYARTRRGRIPPKPDVPAPAAPPLGADSEFYMVERRLAMLAFERAPGEPLGRWIARIEARRPASVSTELLHPLLRLHYRYRFDPQTLTADERADLRATALRWLAGHEAATGAPR
ncbi:MAG TPA: transglutaminase-like domain-containing protein [Methylomirabilota bacterium]